MKVSICIATYNSEKYIRCALNAIKNQTYSDFEVIIVDDYSTDNTCKIIKEEFCDVDSRFKLFTDIADRNQPFVDAHNKSYQLATGEWLFRLDHDDRILPDYLEYCVNCINNDYSLEVLSVKAYRNTEFGFDKEYTQEELDAIDERNLAGHEYYDSEIARFYRCPIGTVYYETYNNTFRIWHNFSSAIKKSFFDKHHLKFDFYAGDEMFWKEVFSFAPKAKITEDAKIIYNLTNDSLSVKQRGIDENKDNVKLFYCAYYMYTGLLHFDDEVIIKDTITVKGLRDIMFNTMVYSRHDLVVDKMWKIIPAEMKTWE